MLVFVFDSDLRKRNITVNLYVVNERWLFSMLWCAGASSVTTNACHLLKEMERPDWVMVSNAVAGCFTVYFIMMQEILSFQDFGCGAHIFVAVFPRICDTL